MSTNRTSDRRASGCTYTPLPLVRRWSSSPPAASTRRPSSTAAVAVAGLPWSAPARFRGRACLPLTAPSSRAPCATPNAVAAGLSERIETVCSDFTELARRGTQVASCGSEIPHMFVITPSRRRGSAGSRRMRGPWHHGGAGWRGCTPTFLAHIAQCWHEGDYGMLVLSAEWLDVNYGASMRWLLSGTLGLDYLRLFDRRAELFSGTQTTATVIGFGSPDDEATVIDGRGAEKRVELRAPAHGLSMVAPAVRGRGTQDGGRPRRRGPARHACPRAPGRGHGQQCVLVRRKGELGDIPESLTTPVVSHARELTGECVVQSDPDSLKRLIVIRRPSRIWMTTRPPRRGASSTRAGAEGLTRVTWRAIARRGGP